MNLLNAMTHDPIATTATLPFNPTNVLLPEAVVDRVLCAYGLSPGSVRDINLYRKAMVHRSYCTRKNENFVEGNVQCPANCAIPLQEESNERLEFLGDAVLNLAVAKYLFERYPDENEGFLTKMRTKLVNGTMLGHLCGLLKLDTYLVVSKQIEENVGRRNVKLLEDCFEAFLGAIYLDHTDGFEAAYTWITTLIETHLDFSELIVSHNNAKDTLLKYCQHHHSFLPKFMELSVDLSSNGGKIYTVCVKDKNHTTIGMGKGASKKQAEQDASKAALAYYGEPVPMS